MSGSSTTSWALDAKEQLETSRDVAVDLPGTATHMERPKPVTHLSTPTYESPLRHHRRTPSTPRQVKETLHAHSEYTNSEDDGTSIHRINQYVIKQEIGRGSFGAVHHAVDQHGHEFAVKEFSKARLRKRAQSSILRRPHHRAARGSGLNAPMHRRHASDIHQEEENGNPLYLIREEIAIMKKLNHHNLVALYEVLDDPTEDSLYMVMEMCKKGVVMKVEVGDRADPYTAEECRCWFRDLILGIEYLHAQGIVHRDIKPDNLLLNDDDILKVVDFGVSEMFEKESDMTTTKSAGSPAFLPPELCVSRHGPISGKAVDIWSMGVTLYCLYFGRVPFEEHGVLELYNAIKTREPQVEPKEGDVDFQDLILRLLEKDPDKRIKMEDLREHPWVTRRGADPLLPAEENTSDLVEPPTETEMNHAITGNLSNLVVVMKAVRKFRRLLNKKRPYLMDTVLGQDARLVQPPLSMSNESSPTLTKTRSEDSNDRRPVERILTTEGVHRKERPDEMDLNILDREDGGAVLDKSKSGLMFRANLVQPTPHRPNFPPAPWSAAAERERYASPSADENTARSPDHPGKGQAHDPLDEFRFLDIGPGDEAEGDQQSPGSPPAVCESPSAADVDIYETAYHEEVERIRSRSMSATLYLTRRVEAAAGVGGSSDGDGPQRRQTAPVPAARMATQAVLERAWQKGQQAREKGQEAKQRAAAKGHEAMQAGQHATERAAAKGSAAWLASQNRRTNAFEAGAGVQDHARAKGWETTGRVMQQGLAGAERAAGAVDRLAEGVQLKMREAQGKRKRGGQNSDEKQAAGANDGEKEHGSTD